MKSFIKNSKKLIPLFVIALVAIVIFSTIQTPTVEAASETNKTETKSLETNAYISSADTEVAINMASIIDEAKAAAEKSVEKVKAKQAKEAEIALQKEAEEAKLAEEIEDEIEEDAKDEVSNDIENDVEAETTSSSSTYIAGSTSSGGLLEISNPDPSYTSYAVALSDTDRDAAERIIMGEAGSMGYEGMALVAQCLRDAYISGGYSSIHDTINSYGYYGSMSITPSQSCKDVVNFIFDQGGTAVQHRILVFYASNACSSAWHESQNFVIAYQNVRFFDRW